MSFLSDIWNQITGAFASALGLLHDLMVGPFGEELAWGWAIIALTLIVRVILLPLAVKQSRSMRAMQELQPQIKKIQAKYPADRALMQKDPELYRKRKAEQNEQLMALYQEEGVNPAASCLPLVAQAPIFFALFSVLRGSEELRDAPFYWVTSDISTGADGSGLGALVSQAGWPGWVLIAAMVVSMFITQRQTMARSSVEGPAAQQQKLLLYVMPAFLAFISRGLPLGVILYWVTTNIWQGVQQWIIFRDANAVDPAPVGGGRPKKDESGSTSTTSSKPEDRTPRGASSESRPTPSSPRGKGSGSKGGGAKDAGSGSGPSRRRKAGRSHLPGAGTGGGRAGGASGHLPGSTENGS